MTHPHNLEAERALLGALLLDPGKYSDVQALVTPEDFYEPKHGTIYAAIADLTRQGKKADLVTTFELLNKSKAGVSGADLAELTRDVVMLRNATEYAHITAEHSAKRRLMKMGEELVAAATSPSTTSEELLARYGNLASKVEPANKKRPQLVHFAETVDAAKAMMAAPGEIKGLSTGWPSVDQLFMGMRGGQLLIVYGETKHRKSTFVRNIVSNLGEQGVPVLFIGLEEVGAKNTERWLGMGFDNLPVVYPPVDQPTPEPEDIDAMVDEAVNQLGVKLVVIDHLHMWKGTKKGEREDIGITNNVQEMKRIAMKYDVPVILVSHISGDKTASGNAPEVDRLKGSTSIKQLADKCICVYSPGVAFASTDQSEIEVYNKLSREMPNQKVARLRILRNARLVEDKSFTPVTRPADPFEL